MDSNEFGDRSITRDNVSKIASTWFDKGGHQNPSLVNAGEAISSIRPIATPREKREEEATLRFGLLEVERWMQKRFPKTYPDKESVMKTIIPIEAGDTKIARELEPQILEIMRLLTTKEYKKLILPAEAGKKVTKRYVFDIFPEDEQKEISFNYIARNGYLLPIEWIEEANTKGFSRADKRAILYKILATDIRGKTFRKEQIFGWETAHLLPEEYSQLVSEAIYKKIVLDNEKDKTNSIGLLDITCGLELEPGKQENKKSIKDIDCVRKAGIPVVYENTYSRREIPLPPAFTIDQIRAVYELFKMGVIKDNQSVKLHINLGEAGKIIDEDIYLFNDIIYAANLFNFSDTIQSDNVTILQMSESGRKSLFKNDPASPKGLPFLQREDGTTLELRSGFEVSGNSFIKFARDLSTVASIAEALCAWRRIKSGESVNIDKDIELSKQWEYLKLEFNSLMAKKLNSQFTSFYDGYRIYGNDMKKITQRYGVHQANIIRNVKRDKELTEKLWGICSSIKTKVILIEKNYRENVDEFTV